MLVRRMLMLMALLMGLAALATVLAPRPSPQVAPTARPVDPVSPAAGSPTEQEERDLAAIAGEPVLTVLDAARSGQVVHLAIGERARVHVRGTELDSVQLGEDGPIEIVTPDAPARFELLVDAPLDHDIRLLESGRVIGRVTTEE